MNRLMIAVFALLLIIPSLVTAGDDKQRSGEVSIKITIDAPTESKDVRLWVPYPVSDEYQTIRNIKTAGNFSSSGIYREKTTGNLALYAEWDVPTKDRFLSLTFDASAKERVRRDFPATEPELPVEALPYLKSTHFIPTDGNVLKVARKATRGKKTIAEKSRAVYDWVVENTHRDPNVRGCGTGEVEVALAKRGGKCADISSIFVAVSRAAGVPAREVFGLRLGKNPVDDMTKGHHCWAEFYMPGYGWVPADPADVRKIMLVKKLGLKQAGEYREYYYGAVDQYRIVLGRGGRGYYLNPKQNDGPLNYFMYPYAEVDGKSLEWLAAQKELKYSITFKELD